MKTTKRFLSAAISMALAFTFSGCYGDGDSGSYDDSSSSVVGGAGSSSSITGGSSSSVVGGAGSSSSITGGSSSSVVSSSSSLVSGDGSSSSSGGGTDGVSSSSDGTPMPLIDTQWYDDNPNALTFTISTAAQLAGLAEIVNNTASSSPYRYEAFLGKTIVLANDIDISAYNSTNSFNSARGWIPIGVPSRLDWSLFFGTFDGNGKTVSGLYINNTALNNAGLFGAGGMSSERAVIKNLNVANVNITAQDIVGAVVGVFYGTMENCTSSGTINGRNTVGGLVGNFGAGNMISSFSTSKVNGEETVGGLAGSLDTDGRVNNSYAIGAISGLSKVGGLLGGLSGRIANCYSAGTVTGDRNIGGIVGYVNSGGEKIINCVALNPRVAANISGAGRVYSAGYTNSAFGNLAFDGIAGANWGAEYKTTTSFHGQDISIAEILADPGMGLRFTENNGWTLVPGKLPGLMGKAVDMSAHLQ